MWRRPGARSPSCDRPYRSITRRGAALSAIERRRYDRRRTRRTWIFVGVGALLGTVVGLVYVLNFDVLFMCPAVEGRCFGTHDEIFGWQPGSFAVPIWTVIGLIGGGLVGWIAAGPMTRIRWVVIGVAAVVGVVAYLAWVYTPDPGFDF